MKLVKKTLLAQLQSQADAFNAIVAVVIESSEGTNPEDVTAETIIEALQSNAADTDLTAVQTALTEANNQLTQAQNQLTAEQTALETANARIQELEDELNNDPADVTSVIVPKGDGGDNTETIAQFADKNKGNTQAILAMAVKDGLI